MINSGSTRAEPPTGWYCYQAFRLITCVRGEISQLANLQKSKFRPSLASEGGLVPEVPEGGFRGNPAAGDECRAGGSTSLGPSGPWPARGLIPLAKAVARGQEDAREGKAARAQVFIPRLEPHMYASAGRKSNPFLTSPSTCPTRRARRRRDRAHQLAPMPDDKPPRSSHSSTESETAATARRTASGSRQPERTAATARHDDTTTRRRRRREGE